jgi:hypothetical protein
VEHPCYRCEAAVEDGVLFCKNCGAPQIRVVAPEPSSERPPQLGFDATQPVSYPGSVYYGRTAQIAWSDAWRVALLCGLLEALFSLFGLGVVAGGALCVALYRRRQTQMPITVGMGARLGAISGGIGGLVVTLVMSVGVLAFRTGDQIRQQIYDAVEKAAARNPTPQAQEILHYVKSPDGFAVILALAFLMTVVVFIALSSLGGVLGATLFNKRVR